MDLKEQYYREGKSWDFSFDYTRWLFGIEWYKKIGWLEINLGCFALTIWWRRKD